MTTPLRSGLERPPSTRFPSLPGADAQPSGRRELGLAGLSEIARGYERAQVLLTANELGIFELLGDGAKDAPELAAAIGAPERGVSALLNACVALGLLRSSAGRYENSRTVSLFLKPGSESSFSPVLRFWREFSYGAWGRLANAVRDGGPYTARGPKPGDLFETLVEDQDQLELFFNGLAGLAYWPAQRIADLVDFGAKRHLLDIGGGSGTFSAVIASRHPHLRVTLFDLEPVCALARERFRRFSSHLRLEAIGGDFHRDTLPKGTDCALLSNVLHDWSAEECLALLGRVREALEPGGEIIIHDFMPSDGALQVEATLFSLALLLDTSRGRVYTREEVEDWLHQIGFLAFEHHEIGPGIGILKARNGG